MIRKLFYKLLSESEIMQVSGDDGDYKFHTTLVKDLYDIADEIGKDFEECGIEVYDVHIYSSLGEVHFKTKGYREKTVRKYIDLKTLEVRRKWYDEEIWWEASYSYFQKKYNDTNIEYVKHLKELADFVKENYKNTAYHYIFNKYEDSIDIVLNTIRESKQENDGNISDDILEKSKIIISKLEVAMDEKKEELESVKSLQDKAVKQSLVGRLDSELEFIEKFLEV